MRGSLNDRTMRSSEDNGMPQTEIFSDSPLFAEKVQEPRPFSQEDFLESSKRVIPSLSQPTLQIFFISLGRAFGSLFPRQRHNLESFFKCTFCKIT
ncbi:hypothetical protein CDAR_110901 [Caerostris darwini]|uniref:Uncharacterized protein n=1 Tax=Caerostris darwini TaxID=1538125 RepID=A0AAV4QM82_9ARAC|nr:hypothetical protein CDAR_110901 [Caerostris darwini]